MIRNAVRQSGCFAGLLFAAAFTLLASGATLLAESGGNAEPLGFMAEDSVPAVRFAPVAAALTAAELRAQILEFEAELAADPGLLDRDSLSPRSFHDAAFALEAEHDARFDALADGFHVSLREFLNELRTRGPRSSDEASLRAGSSGPADGLIWLFGQLPAATAQKRQDSIRLPSKIQSAKDVLCEGMPGSTAVRDHGGSRRQAVGNALPPAWPGEPGIPSPLRAYVALIFHAGPSA